MRVGIRKLYTVYVKDDFTAQCQMSYHVMNLSIFSNCETDSTITTYIFHISLVQGRVVRVVDSVFGMGRIYVTIVTFQQHK